MKRNVFVFLYLFLFVTVASAQNFLKPEALRENILKKKPIIIVDVQKKENFKKHHIKNSIETNAYPVKSEEDKKKLDVLLNKILSSKDDVVIVCPKGKGAAMNTYEYLKSKGVPENRLFILEGGITGWPYKDLLEVEN